MPTIGTTSTILSLNSLVIKHIIHVYLLINLNTILYIYIYNTNYKIYIDKNQGISEKEQHPP